jgi:hypothetical protein
MIGTVPIKRIRNWAALVGVVFAIVSLVGAFLDRPQFFRSYLFGWLFWSGLSFGALVVAMMQYLTGGQWGLALRNLAHAAFALLPAMAVLFIPVLVGMSDIYVWVRGEFGPPTVGFHHKQQWLTVPWFTARSIAYFVLLSALAMALRRWTASREPLARSAPAFQRVKALSAGGLVLYILCMNFASTDWVMSLDPAWYSTVFVIVFAAGHFLGALALLTLLFVVAAVWESRPQPETSATVADRRYNDNGQAIPWKVLNDLGNMLLAFVIFWTYVSFSQFLITWAGNLPKEISWYLPRSQGGWQWVALGLALFEFLIPFALLLFRAAKGSPRSLGGICLCILGANIVNYDWMVGPAFHPKSFAVHWLDLTLFLALGGIWFAGFLSFLQQRPVLPAEYTEALPKGTVHG